MGCSSIRRLAVGLIWASTACATAPPSVAPPAVVVEDVPWSAWTARATELLQRLVAVDTARPRGARRAAPDVLQAFLRRESVDAEVLPVGGGRFAVWGRVEAVDAQGPPVVLLSHLDTPTTDAAAWPAETPPFSLTLREGRMWGAGLRGGKGLAVYHATALAVLASVGGPRKRDVHLVALPDALDLSARSLDRVIAAVPAIATATVALSGGGFEVADWLGDGRPVQAIAVGDRGTAVLQIAALTRSDGVGPASGERLARALVAIQRLPRTARLTPTNRALLKAVGRGLTAPERWLTQSGLGSKLFVVPELLQRPGLASQFIDEIEAIRIDAGRRGGTEPPYRSRAFVRVRLLEDATPGAIRRKLAAAIRDPNVHVTVRVAAPTSKSSLKSPWIGRIRRGAGTPPETVTIPVLSGRPHGADPLRTVGVPVLGFVPLAVTLGSLANGGPQPLKAEAFRTGLKRMVTLVASLSAE